MTIFLKFSLRRTEDRFLVCNRYSKDTQMISLYPPALMLSKIFGVNAFQKYLALMLSKNIF